MTPRPERAAVWALGFSAMAVVLRLPFIRLPFDATDEGYYASVAQGTVRGGRLYADLWYVRPPFLNAVYAWSYRISLGTVMPYDLAVRIFAAVFAAATVGCVAWWLFTEFSPQAAFTGSAVAALMVASLTLQNEANAETWMLLPYVLSALLVLYVALREPPFRRAVWLVALAGALTGVAAAFKQVALVNLALPVVAWIALDRTHVRRWLAHATAFLAGIAGAWVAILGWLTTRDGIRAFLYFAWFRNYLYVNRSHAGFDTTRVLATSLEGLALAFTISAAVALVLLGLVLANRAVAPGKKRIALFAFGWLCLSAIGVAASGRFYQHYFIQATIPLVLLLAASLDAVLTAENSRRATSIALRAMIGLALVSAALSWIVDVRSVRSVAAERGVLRDLGERLPQLAAPGGSLFIWGIRASVRAYCPLPWATQLPVASYDYGWSPISRARFMGEEFPSTGDVVLADLRRSAPDLVVLTAPLRAGGPTSPASRQGSDDAGLESTLYTRFSRSYVVVERGDGYVVMRRAD